jgi:hypothetical protein
MGLRPSPFRAVQIIPWLDDTFFEGHLDQYNVFCWDVVKLNLPGMPSYFPSKHWVYKKRSGDGIIEADEVTYINDARPTRPSKEECTGGSKVHMHLKSLWSSRYSSETPTSLMPAPKWIKPV